MMNPFRTFMQLWHYHSSIDVEKALRAELWRGIDIGKRRQPDIVYGREIAPSMWKCEHTTPLVVLMTGLLVCPECRKLDTVPLPIPRPTIKLVAPPDFERNTGPINTKERPLFNYRRGVHPDEEAGTETQTLRAIHARDLAHLDPDDVPTQQLNKERLN